MNNTNLLTQNIRTFISYKAFLVKEAAIELARLFLKPITYAYVWFAMALSIFVVNFVYNMTKVFSECCKNAEYALFKYQLVPYHYVFIPLIFIIMIWAYLDYKSGIHIRWSRDRKGLPKPSDYKKFKRLKNGMEKKNA